MQYDVKTVEEYLEQIPVDWRREKLESVRNMIKTAAPKLQEGIEYKMLRFGDEDRSVFHLNAQKNYVSLYLGNIEKVEGAAELLQAFDRGKGCIRIKKNTDLPETGLATFIERVIAIWQAGGNTDC